MLKPALICMFFLCCHASSFAQYTQRIRGMVTDKESHVPLTGVAVSVIDVNPHIGGVTGEDGSFSIENVTVGKHTIEVNYVGYNAITIPNVLVTSGKEVQLNLEMEESSHRMAEVVIAAKKEHINEMAIVSAKTFDVQETERYAGSRGDPARMASNFAGVQGADDSRNDIIIRGNSPQGVLWRLEEINIPNPNHFAIPGTTGGPVSILNNKTLGNSDFFTGAFPAEYGNSTAGVFDLKMRNGNSDKREFTGQFGFLGTELAAEGPISKKSKSSYLITYRYSTLKLFESLHIKIGTNSVPNYQDAAIKLNFPVNKKANFAIFGIGGLSNIDLIVSNLSSPPEELYGESDRDQYFHSNTGVAGVSFSYIIDPATYTRLVVAQTYSDIGAQHIKVFRDADYHVTSLKDILGYEFVTNSTSAHWYINRKLSARQTLKAGIVNELYALNLVDSSRQYPPTLANWQHRLSFVGTTDLLQPYVQYKYRPSDAVTLTAGLHGQYLTHNHTSSLEPRMAARWRVGSSDIISLGYGLHSQAQQLYQYFAHLPYNTQAQMHNYDIDFTRSHHIVGGYEHIFSQALRVRTEAYYQYMFNVPVELRANSSFSALDQGASFGRLFPDTLQNTGKGYNYGLELTVEKSFSHGYYLMFTGSLYDSKAKGNDGVYRSTDYDSKFATNLLGGYEYKLGRNSTLLLGGKITWAGGKLYSPPDTASSNALGDYIVIDSLRNTLHFPDYFRIDAKLGVRINKKHLTHEIAIDLVNITNAKNVLSLTYSSDLAAQGQYPFIREYQLGFLPLFYYRIDFGSTHN